MSPLAVVVVIVLIDLLGFSIVMPLLPRFAAEYGFGKVQIGLLLAAYPMLQLVAGPVLGRLSDRYGRRPLLVLSQAGTALSFVVLGLSRNYTVMLVARMLDGASGGNILVAQAYVADVTRPEHRARGLGLIGAAFGVGFVLGPLLGGLLLSERLPVPPGWRLRVPFLVAAGFSTLAWLLVLFGLPESLRAGARARETARVVSWHGLVETVRRPAVGRLVGVAALVVLAFAALEGTFSLYLKERMRWGAEPAAYAFAYLGLVNALVQGGLIRRLVPRFGEPWLILAGIATVGVGFAGLALVDRLAGLLVAVLLVGIGQGLASPSVLGLLSRITPTSEQGAIFGTLSSAQTLARMTNYLAANALLAHWGTAAPYWEAAALSAFTLALAWSAVRRVKPLGDDDLSDRLPHGADVSAPTSVPGP